MTNLPTDDQIRDELHIALKKDPKLKCCANCIHYNRVTEHCEKIDKTFPRYMYGCKFYITAEEMLIAKAREELLQQAKECDKIEFLLAMALTSAGMTSLFIEDFERRVKAVHNKEKDRTAKGHLRKDLDLADQVKKAFKTIYAHLEKIDQQYRFYIQTHLDKVFKKEGLPYNVEAYDQYLSDSGEFATFLLEMARVAHHNKSNMDKVYQFMHDLKNDNITDKDRAFCLEDKDIAHYRLKE